MTAVTKRSVTIRGHRTSFSLEREFLEELQRIATERRIAFAALVAEIDAARPKQSNLSSALRLHVVAELKRAARLP